MSEPEVLARHRNEVAELVLRRRPGPPPVYELVVDGVFAMDSAHTETERALADLALARLDGDGPLTVVVGGLGLGHTGRALLADRRVARVHVVELHAVLAEWMRAGLLPGADLLADPRVRLQIADVADAVPALAPGTVDAVLLDVDNGPGFLVHQGNARLYQEAFLAAAARTLRPGGILAIWSADPAPALVGSLSRACGTGEEVLLPVRRDGREFDHAVYLGRSDHSKP